MQNIFLPSVLKVWNNIPSDTCDCQSLNIFKRRISNECISPPKYYYIGSKLGQVLHTRLRLNCSSLNSHLFVRNLVCSPNCTCGKIETTAHFLLECPKYSVLRQELFSCIDNYNLNIEISVNLLVFGSSHLTDLQNSNIFRLTQSYILKSKRFLP